MSTNMSWIHICMRISDLKDVFDIFVSYWNRHSLFFILFFKVKAQNKLYNQKSRFVLFPLVKK